MLFFFLFPLYIFLLSATTTTTTTIDAASVVLYSLFLCMFPPTVGGKGILVWGRPSIRPSVVRYPSVNTYVTRYLCS